MAGARLLGSGRVLAVLTVLGLAAACGESASSGPPDLVAAPGQRDLVGVWEDADGQPLPDGRGGDVMVIQSSAGSTTCSRENVTVFLELAWPPGRRLNWGQAHSPGDSYRYVRDTQGSAMKTDGQSDLQATLPADAETTRIGREGNVLYAVAGKPTSIWMRRGDGHVERWARLGDDQGCA